jgi:3-mercaptopyruvate sulfurtransferase SseA
VRRFIAMHILKVGEKVVLGRRILTSIFSLLFLLCLFFGYQNVFASGVPALVETQWLADNLKKPGIRLVYVGNPSPKSMANFGSKHINGSVYLSVKGLLNVLGNGSMPPDKAKFEALMGKLGISNDTDVVLYGAGGRNPFITNAF